MHPWHNLSPVATEKPCKPVKPLKRVKRSHGGDLSERRSRRSLVGTAPLTLDNDDDTAKGSGARTCHTSLAVLLAPLSKRSRAPALRQRSRSATRTQTHTGEYTDHTRKHHLRARGGVLRHSKHPRLRVSATRAPIRISLRTKLLLRCAQQAIEGSTGASRARPRRPRFVMDVLLDLQSLSNDDDVIAELLRSSHQSIWCLSRYAPAAEYPGGLMSLDRYWIGGPASWASGTRAAVEDGISTRFPESYERSTACQAA